MSEDESTSEEWPPETEIRHDAVSATAAAQLHDLLDRPGFPPQHNEPMPALWHWLAFLPQSPQSALGHDGHPSTVGILPTMTGRRRMFAGATITVPAPLRIGHTVERRTKVANITEKNGRTGPLMFVTVEHCLTSAGRQMLRETNDLVYRAPASSGTPSAPAAATKPVVALHDQEWAWGRDVPVDPVLLFRFSALTYNAHRIHYDRDYAMAFEGYPGLVVHGPLQAVLLADLLERESAGTPVRSFTFRAHTAAFDDGTLRLRGREHQDGSVELKVFDDRGNVTLSATATLAEAGR